MTTKYANLRKNYLEQVVCHAPVLQKYIQTNRQKNRPGPSGDPTGGRPPEQRQWNQTKTKIRNQKRLDKSQLI